MKVNGEQIYFDNDNTVAEIQLTETELCFPKNIQSSQIIVRNGTILTSCRGLF